MPLEPENSSSAWKPRSSLLPLPQPRSSLVLTPGTLSALGPSHRATSAMSAFPNTSCRLGLTVCSRCHASAAIVGLDHAYYERFPDLLSALRALAAGAKTGELMLGYNAPPTHHSSGRIPAPQVLREQEGVADVVTRSLLYDHSSDFRLHPSAVSWSTLLIGSEPRLIS